MNRLKISALAFAVVAAAGFSGCTSGPFAFGGGELTKDNFAERISEAQLEAGSVQMDQDMSVSGQSMTMSAEIVMAETFEEIKMDMSMDAAGVATDMIIVDGDAYVGMGELMDGMYMKMSLDELAASDPTFDENSLVPTANLDAYSEAIESLETAPGEEIDGVETTKLTMVMNTQELMDATGQSDTGAVETLGETITYDMYVGDDDDLPRRLIMDLGVGETEVNFTNWGAEFDITAPPAEEVMES